MQQDNEYFYTLQLTNTYSQPYFLGADTRSQVRDSNGFSTTGMGYNGAGLICWLGFPLIDRYYKFCNTLLRPSSNKARKNGGAPR